MMTSSGPAPCGSMRRDLIMQVIMEREHSNPEFNFLFDVRCPEHAYYRWRLFSLANGDSLRRCGKVTLLLHAVCRGRPSQWAAGGGTGRSRKQK